MLSMLDGCGTSLSFHVPVDLAVISKWGPAIHTKPPSK